MKKLCAFLALLSIFFYAPAQADSFISGMEDVPIMNGFKQIQSDTVSFGNESSHFLEATLESDNVSYKDYRKYYTDTMPQLGWKLKKSTQLKLVFLRGQETLEISQEYAKPLTLRISVYGEN